MCLGQLRVGMAPGKGFKEVITADPFHNRKFLHQSLIRSNNLSATANLLHQKVFTEETFHVSQSNPFTQESYCTSCLLNCYARPFTESFIHNDGPVNPKLFAPAASRTPNTVFFHKRDHLHKASFSTVVFNTNSLLIHNNVVHQEGFTQETQETFYTKHLSLPRPPIPPPHNYNNRHNH